MKRLRALAGGSTALRFSSQPQLCSHHLPATSLLSPRPFSRFISSSGITVPRIINPRSGREAYDPPPEKPTLAARESARARREREGQRVEDVHRHQLSFNAYNRDLSARVKATEDWTQLLRLLSAELSTTRYNAATERRWLNPNLKHTQLTVACVQVIVLRLIKLRGTRRRAMTDDGLMQTLHSFVVLVETMAPRLHTEDGVWRWLYHPYLYLRRQVELWREAREAEWKRRRAEADARRERETEKGRGILTDAELRGRAKAAAQRRKAAGLPAQGKEAEEEPKTSRRPVPWDRFMAGEEDDEVEAAYSAMSPDEKMRMQLAFLLEQEQNDTNQYSQAKQAQANEEGEEQEERPSVQESPASTTPRSRTRRAPPSFF